MIELERHDGVAELRLSKSVTNPIDLELIAALHTAVREVRDDPDIRAVVLGSANDKFLSIGFDIPNLFPLDREDFREFYRAFNRVFTDLYSLPKPVVAALTGHAIAGGCVLALAADDRVAAEGRKLIGLNEVKLGVPVPFPADCAVRALLPTRHAKAVIEDGEFHESAAALGMGLVDEVRPLDEVWVAATERAARKGATPGGAWAIIKANRVDPVLAEVRARRTEREEAFLDCWFAPGTREKLEAAIANF
ncbi:MAG: enoyl-CoA hydratase/isomerase family protein [Planctomycetota bacterium]